jgi:hypothetical protein
MSADNEVLELRAVFHRCLEDRVLGRPGYCPLHRLAILNQCYECRLRLRSRQELHIHLCFSSCFYLTKSGGLLGASGEADCSCSDRHVEPSLAHGLAGRVEKGMTIGLELRAVLSHQVLVSG